jgi:uncharacterized membrane protein YdbT with pleckstrin-like domain
MTCSRCGAAPPPGSAFCNRCGAALGGAPAPTAPAPPAPESAPEEELWKARPSLKAQAHAWILWVLEAAAVAYVWWGVLSPEMRGNPIARAVCAAAVGLPLAALLWGGLLRKASVRYRLTTHRLFREVGILFRQLNEVELVRVDDVSVRQNLLQRIFNVGTITVIAPTDATEPRLELEGVENPIEVKEEIRRWVRKRRERSLYLESL